MPLSRRTFVSAGLLGCGACCAQAAWSKVLPTEFEDVLGHDYEPVDDDERGLWHACDRLERDLADSSLVLDAPDLQAYVVGVVEKLTDATAEDFRIYLVRDPTFNASMAPNGLMIVHTGLLARVQDEAQLASILGHESGHYYCRHTVERWRSLRLRSAVTAFVGAGASVAGGVASIQGYNGQSWLDIANAINLSIVLSMFSFSRGQESEADAYGIARLAHAGYATTSAAAIWQQLIEERQASAAMRNKGYKDRSRSLMSTHPPNEERMRDLRDTAEALERDAAVAEGKTGRERWLKARQPHLAALLDEQVKLNDPGASLYLIDRHAADGWTGELHYYQGEAYRLRGAAGDADLAASAYAAAVAFDDAPAEAWRARGYALLKQRHRDDGRAALTRYLELKPDAPDAAMVRHTLSQ